MGLLKCNVSLSHLGQRCKPNPLVSVVEYGVCVLKENVSDDPSDYEKRVSSVQDDTKLHALFPISAPTSPPTHVEEPASVVPMLRESVDRLNSVPPKVILMVGMESQGTEGEIIMVNDLLWMRRKE